MNGVGSSVSRAHIRIRQWPNPIADQAQPIRHKDRHLTARLTHPVARSVAAQPITDQPAQAPMVPLMGVRHTVHQQERPTVAGQLERLMAQHLVADIPNGIALARRIHPEAIMTALPNVKKDAGVPAGIVTRAIVTREFY